MVAKGKNKTKKNVTHNSNNINDSHKDQDKKANMCLLRSLEAVVLPTIRVNKRRRMETKDNEEAEKVDEEKENQLLDKDNSMEDKDKSKKNDKEILDTNEAIETPIETIMAHETVNATTETMITTATKNQEEPKKPLSALAARRAKKRALEVESSNKMSGQETTAIAFTETLSSQLSSIKADDTSLIKSTKENKKSKKNKKNKKQATIASFTTTIKTSETQYNDDNVKTTNNNDIDMTEYATETESLNLEEMDPEEIPTPMNQSEAEDIPNLAKKEPSKRVNKLIRDPNSVSTFSTKNVLSFEHNGENYLCIGFKKSEELVFLGYVLIGTLFGSVQINGAILSSKESNIPSNLDQEDIQPWETVSFQPVFSPRTSSLVRLKSIPYETSMITSTAKSIDVAFSNLKPLLKSFESTKWNDFESMIIVKRLDGCGMNELQDVLFLFRDMFRFKNKNNYFVNNSSFFLDIPKFLPIMKTTYGVRAFQIQPSWSNALDQLIDYEKEHLTPSISVICGGGNVGKSSFGRYMINRLLNIHQRVAYLETDVGQSEFTPSGLVTLHIIDSPILGPPFTHSHLKSKRSYFIGSNSPSKDPDYYLLCISELINVWENEKNRWLDEAKQQQESSDASESSSTATKFMLPLIVNTHGWIKGLGYDLIMSIINNLTPTHVFSFYSPYLNTKHGRQLPPEFFEEVMNNKPFNQDRRLVYLQSEDLLSSYGPNFITNNNTDEENHENNNINKKPQQLNTWASPYLASDLRHLMFLSYIFGDHQRHQQLDYGNGHKSQWWKTTPRLIDRIPWYIDWTKNLNGIWILFEDVPYSEILYSINGSLVGLAGPLTHDEDNDIMIIENNGHGNINNNENNENESNESKKFENKKIIPPKYFSAMNSNPPNPSTTTCYGLGIIRSIDPKQHRIYILTSLSKKMLQHVNSIVKGDLELPIDCMLDDRRSARYGIAGVPWRKVPYLTEDTVQGMGGGVARIRRNLMRKSQQVK